MKRRVAGWLDLFHTVGRAFLELLRAELEALAADLKISVLRLRTALLLLLFAAFLLFWALGALALSSFEILALWLPRWSAALVVLGFLLLLAAIAGLLARWRLRGLESPTRTVRRRFSEHAEWWQARALAAESSEEPPAEGET